MAGKKLYELDPHGPIVDTDVVAISATDSGDAEKSTTAEIKAYVKSGLSTDDVSASTDKNYVTDAQATVIGNTSGTNTGDEDATSIKTKLGISTLSGSNTGDQDLSGLASKINVLELDNTDAFTPTDDYHPATKKYVDDNAGSGGDVTGPTSSTDGNVAMFNGATGKLLKDSGVSLSGTNTGDQVGDGVTITGTGTVGDPFVSVATGTGDVTASGTLTDDAIILGGGTTVAKTSSKTIVTTLGADDTTVPTSGAVAAAISGSGGGDVSGPASSVDSNVAMFNGTTGKLLKDSGVSLSGSNTGDENTSSIKTKLGAASTSTDGYLTSTDWNTFNGKQAALSVASGAEVDTGTDNTKYVTAKAVADSKVSYTDGAETLTNKTLTDAKNIQAINAQTGTTYTFSLADASKLVTLGNASPIAVTIPTNASVAFPIGTQIDCVQILAGKVTIGGAGVTINSKGGLKSLGGQWVGVSLVKTATDTWLLVGDLIA